MSHRRLVSSFVTLLAFLFAASALAQTGDGSLRGYVKDEQGGALPGATVTAKSPALLRPLVGTTDGEGYYRIINLPPGEYALTVELAGFTTTRREGILLRGGANFQVDVSLKIGALEETITVAGESPMLEVSKPGNVLNIDGEFQKQMPIAARRNWTDFLELTPGVHSRPFDDGSGRMVYFGHSTEHFAHVVQLEGMQAGSYNDFQLTYVQMGADMIDDTQVKTGGVDASTPMGTGLAINVITKSGGNQFRGTGGYALQPLKWNGDNTNARTVFKLPSEVASISGCPNGECVSTGGSPAQFGINQFDASIGGPIRRDRIWFFGSFRYSDVEVPISRIDKQIRDITSYFPDRQLFRNWVENNQPYAKVTARLSAAHELTGVYQRDRLIGTSNWEYLFDPTDVYSNGGDLFSAKLASVWGRNVTTTLLAGYNDKGGADLSTYEASGFQGTGPRIEIYEGSEVRSGLRVGNNVILEGSNRSTENIVPASLITIRGDLTWYKPALGGSHEVQTGFFLAPRNTYDQITRYTNDGFILERQVPVNVNNPAAGTRPFY
ncbi:MAG: carboxypeptidase regulatory-like domain-containing protein, partial [Vicinamibacterales bacterium]